MKPDASSVPPAYTYNGAATRRFVGRYVANTASPADLPVLRHERQRAHRHAALGRPIGSRSTRCRSRSSIRRSTTFPIANTTLVNTVRLPNVDYQRDVERMIRIPACPSTVATRRSRASLSSRCSSRLTALLALSADRGRVRRRIADAVAARPGLERIARGGRGRRSTTSCSGSTRTPTTSCTTRRTSRPTATRRSPSTSRCPAATRSRQFRYSTDTSKIAVDGTILITLDRARSARHEAHRAGDAAPPDVHRLPVLHGLRDAGPGAVHRPAVHRRHDVHPDAGDDELHDVRLRDAGPRLGLHRDQLHHRRHT